MFAPSHPTPEPPVQDRRSFLAALAASSLGACARVAVGSSPGDANATLDAQVAGTRAAAGTAPLGPIGVQLYTLRDEMQKDVAATLERVARIGYKEVEFAGYFGKSPSEIRAILDRNGLRAPSVHVPIEVAEGSGWSAALDAAKTVGHEYVVIPWLAPDRRGGLDSYRRLAATLNRAAQEAQRAGLRFAYHNHDFEFEPQEGRLPLDLLLAETDAALVQIELDLYWAVKAGQDPLTYFARHPGRFPMVHVKDSAGPPNHEMRSVGQGTIDFGRIFARRQQAGIRHYFVEHDNPGDAWASIETSYRTVAAMRV
jgi:sugar phosphate isomerase/epimerase